MGGNAAFLMELKYGTWNKLSNTSTHRVEWLGEGKLMQGGGIDAGRENNFFPAD